MNTPTLTERQQHELDYHRAHAREHQRILDAPFPFDVIENPQRRWWNAYWRMYAYILSLNPTGKRALIVGCGFGDDALRLAKLGARVSAFDLSPESLDIARRLATRESLDIDFRQMPAERLEYADDTFDIIVARDILHHVDIAASMREIARVGKPDAMFVANEIYSHSVTDKVRHSRLVEQILYPRMQRLIYGASKPYITADERKLSERDIATITAFLRHPELKQYFNFITTRLVPDRSDFFAKLDRVLLGALKPFGSVLAGRILLAAHIAKNDANATDLPPGNT